MFDIAKKEIEIANDEEKAFDPDFWDDSKAAEAFMRQLRNKKSWVTEYEEAVELTEELEVTYEFFKEEEVDEKDLEKAHKKALQAIEQLEFKNMLRDRKSVV